MASALFIYNLTMPLQTFERRTEDFFSTSPIELLAVALSRSESDEEMVSQKLVSILKEVGSPYNLIQKDYQFFFQHFGLTVFEFRKLHSTLELGRRGSKSAAQKIEAIDKPEDAYLFLRERFNRQAELFLVISLTSKNKIIHCEIVHRGTLTATVVGAREVFAEALRWSASSIIIAHNHPSGDPTPSPEDLEVTRHLKKVGEALEIPIRDHIIVGENQFHSFARHGQI